MRALRTIEADGFEIIMSIVNPIVDPMASKVAARDRLGKEARYKDVIAEMVRAPEYFQSVKGQENIGDEEAERLEILMHKAGKFEKVTRTGEIIADNRGRVWYRYDGAWERGEIHTLGDALPDGAVWREDLSVNQLRSIHEHEELEKIAMLSPESRVQAAEVEIQAAKRAAVIRRMESEITGETEGLEDARTWYRREIARISSKYNIPSPKNIDES